MFGNDGKSYFSILIAILVLVGLMCAGVGYTVYNQTVYNLDTDDMKNSLGGMQTELNILKDSVSDNLAMLNSSTIDIGDTKEILKEELVTINNQITETSDAIDKFNQMLNQETVNVENSYNDLVSQYSEIQEGMISVTNNINSFNNKLDSEIEYLSTRTSENHVETINTLKTIQGSMSNSNEEFVNNLAVNFKNIDNDFNKLEEQNKKGFSNIEDLIGESNKKMDMTIDSLQGNMDNQLLNINDSLSNNSIELTNQISGLKTDSQNNYKSISENLMANYDNLSLLMNNNYNSINNSISSNAIKIDTLESKVDQVFTFASEGKRMLAETLTGYNIDTANDAKFNTINENINLLYTKAFTDGVSSVGSPNVHYEYHQHVDGNSVSVNEEYSSSDIGGCYTKASHKHVDGNGNYRTEEFLLSSGGCYTKGSHSHSLAGCAYCSGGNATAWVERGDGTEPFSWGKYRGHGMCMSCGGVYAQGNWYDDEGSAWSDAYYFQSSCNQPHYYRCPNNTNCYYPNCSKEKNYYESDCGYRNGDIERAIIEYR